MSGFAIRVLGPVEPVFDGAVAPLPGRKLCCILGTLALRAGTDVRRDELIEELGLARTSGNTINALHAHIARLRRWLHPRTGHGAVVLRSTANGYALDIGRDRIDVHAFTDRYRQAAQLAPSTPSVVSSILEEALSFWRGDEAFEGVGDGPLLTAAAGEIQRMRRTAREMVIDAWLALHDNAKVIAHAPRFLADDPLDEYMHAQHIVALRRCRREIDAIEAYRKVERILLQELGIRPSSALQQALVGPLGDSCDARWSSYTATESVPLARVL